MMAPKSTGRPVAYLRKSRVTQTGGTSHEEQLAAVQKMAADAGHPIAPADVFEDWNVSGRKGRDRRPGFDAMLKVIETDQASIVYSFDMSRLSRSVRDLLDLIDLCKAHGVPITTVAHDVDTSSVTGELLVTILAAVNAAIAGWSREHSIAGVAIARAAGYQIGSTRYGEGGLLDKLTGAPIGVRDGEDLAAVVKAFETAGSYSGAASLLNATGVKTRATVECSIKNGPDCPGHPGRKGAIVVGHPWGPRTVTRIVRGDPERGRVGAVPGLIGQSQRGVRFVSTRMFSGLLACHCGATLTSMGTPEGGVSSYCYAAKFDKGNATEFEKGNAAVLDPGHAHPYTVSESKVRPWIEAKVDGLAPIIRGMFGNEPDPADVAARMAALDARARAARDMFELGATKVEVQERLAAIEVERSKIVTRGTLTGMEFLRKVDWSESPGVVNGQLRRLFKRVELGADLLPVRAVWHPTERYGEDGPE